VGRGPAGQGKTALLRSLRAEAAALGVRVLSATGAQIERDFAFGLVRQLFEGELLTAGAGRRDQLLAGAAALAAPVFAAEHGPTETTDVSHARLHGLFWLVVNLAEGGPLAFVVDDAHWGDAASLRFLDVLARRIEDVPVVLAVGARPAEPGADQDLLDAIAAGGAAQVLRPAALSAGAVSGLLRDALGAGVDPDFTGACVDATRGNPLLVRELLRTLAAEDVRGRADEAALVRRAVPGTITRTVVSRLRRLSPESLATARAVAVLGDDARLGTVAELAGLSPEAAAAAHTGLVRVGLLADEGLRFVHPMVAQAVHADLVGAERGRSHRRAAGLLAASGARADRIAVHLLHTDPEGDGWAADVLTAAGRRALSDGAPDTALRLLARAMEEPPDEAARPALALHLGLALARAGQGAGALQHLDEAIEHGDVAVVAHAARLRGNLLVMLGRAGEASASMRAPLAAVAAQDPELAAGLEDDLLGTLPYRLGDLGEYRERLEAGEQSARPTLLAYLCFSRAMWGAPAKEVVDLARRALADGTLVGEVANERFAPSYVIEALYVVEAAGEALDVLRQCLDAERRSGSRVAAGSMSFMEHQWYRLFGDLRRAEADARRGLAISEDIGAVGAAMMLRGALVGILIERGELASAVELAAALPPVEQPDFGTIGAHAVRGRVFFEQGRLEEALEQFELQHANERARDWVLTNRESTRSMRALALAGVGRRDEARALADAEIALAVRRGVAGAEAVARRTRAALVGEEEALDELRRAQGAAARSPSLQIRARVLAELGRALRRAGLRTEARTVLAEARELAHRCGARGLEQEVHEELVVAGARPRRVALSGLDALTASERRVADLAAQGMRNRDIAQTLFVTLKTVETHLGRIYAKLGIRGRSQLAEALAGGTGAGEEG
jgi:DNA-binding CsgD family transcriptional regulator